MLSSAPFILLCAVSMPALGGEVRVPLAEYQEKQAQLERLAAAQTKAAQGAGVAVGETIYRGRSDGRNLRMQLRLHARLGDADVFKTVPVIGIDAVVLSASHQGRPVSLVKRGDRWLWNTRARGPVELTVDFVVPPRGPRGSIEYRFGVIESPVTKLFGFFPFEGLSPRVSGAVTSEVRPVEGGTELEATLRPTRQIHVVGLYDVRGDDQAGAKVYGETHNLVALGEDSIELFSVAQFTILYAAERRFRIELPAGYEIVSADGQGAFTYRVETIDHRPVLVGETAFGMRDRYEISLRLERALGPGDTRVRLPVPRLLDVERDTGFVAIEVPGKLSVEKVEGEGLVGIDVRELPRAIVENAVTPVVRAFRFADRRSAAHAEIARYPEAALAAGGVDHLKAVTVLTADGNAMTEARFSIRNNLKQYLTVKLGDGAKVKSAAIDGEPIKPSRDDEGRILIPLVRSRRSGSTLVPFRVQLVYEEALPALGLLGRTKLRLPEIELPIASVAWRVRTPGGYETTDLTSDHAPQTFVKNAGWQGTGGFFDAAEDPYDLMAQGIDPSISDEHRAALREGRASGAVPVRVSVPEAGHALSFSSYWVDPARPVEVRFSYARTPLVMGAAVIATVLMALFGFFFVRFGAERRLGPAVGAGAVAATMPLAGASLGWSVLLLGAAYLATHQRAKQVAEAGRRIAVANASAVLEKLAAFKAELAAGFRERFFATSARLAWLGARIFLAVVAGAWVVQRTLAMVELLGRPL